MNVTLTQNSRWLILDTPLGKDALVSTSFNGFEGISKLFEFKIGAISPKKTIDPEQLIGKSVTVSAAHPNQKRRFFNGIVTELAAGLQTRDDYRLYTLTIAPSLWILQRSSDFKIFQDKTAVEIIEETLRGFGIKYEKTLNASYAPRDYCVQYGETDLHFIERLMAEEGIFYYFTHCMGEHKLILADHNMAYKDCDQKTVAYRQNQKGATNAIFVLDLGFQFIDTKWTLQDYDFEKPKTTPSGTKSTIKKPASSKSWSHFQYPGRSIDTGVLAHRAKMTLEAEEVGYERANGMSTCASFTPGHRFTLDQQQGGHAAGRTFVATTIHHEVYDQTHFTVNSDAEGKAYYRNRFECIPSSCTFRNPFPIPKSLATGPQTALVVGANGEEIHTDKYGRIRVQFHWDRYGTKNEKSSCFIRVAQTMAGSNWGGMFIPRVGMEVIVQFLNGDPDQPLVTGAVYNADNMPPWALPSNMTKSGILTRSSKNGKVDNANELSFEDKKGSELITIHAERNFLREVEHDDTLDVQNDQTRTIKNNRTSTITDGNDTFTIKSGHRDEKIEAGNETLKIDRGNRKVVLGQGDDDLTLDRGNRKVSLGQGNDSLVLSAGNYSAKASLGKMTFEAAQGITLKSGPSTIEITPAGITVKGITVSVEATATATLKGALVNISAQAIATLRGALVKIN